MSTKHLGQGSTQPPKEEGKWRLYSMAYCPYAQRARLILKLKGVPHEIVNIDLKNKPDWYLKISPAGKVPLLDTGSELVSESLDICDFINEKYPNPPLYNDENSVEEDKKLIKSFGNIITSFYQAVYTKTGKLFQEHLEEITPHLKELNEDLKKRGKFFGGTEPKMVDYMLWPWAERSPLIGMVYDEKLPLNDLEIPNLVQWCEEMKKQETIKELMTDIQQHYRLALHNRNGEKIDFDNL